MVTMVLGKYNTDLKLIELFVYTGTGPDDRRLVEYVHGQTVRETVSKVRRDITHAYVLPMFEQPEFLTISECLEAVTGCFS